MPVTVIVGTQWGDEGKGKAVDYFARDYDFVARYNGGNNAGHTVVNDLGTFKIHLIPSGIFYPHTRCLLGGGMVIDPISLLEEMETLTRAGVKLGRRVLISPRAHVIMPYHRILDGLYEEAKGPAAVGTTRRGIGPVYADKVSYNGIRWGDFADTKHLENRLAIQFQLKNKIISALGGTPLDFDTVCAEYRSYYEKIKPFVRELFPIVQQGLRAKKRFLLEQAMGVCLDTDWGTYPFVTASTTLASAATGGLGIPPREIKHIVGVTKAYTTRVGAGPMPTEIREDSATKLALQEIAATTGRTRRGGWFDAELVRFAVQVNGVAELFLTKLDVLSQFDQIQVGVGYRFEGKRMSYVEMQPFQLAQAEPIYRTLPGWQKDITGIRRYTDLPFQARRYVETIEKLVQAPVRRISVGPQRDAVIRK